jgi:hypothetical protein
MGQMLTTTCRVTNRDQVAGVHRDVSIEGGLKQRQVELHVHRLICLRQCDGLSPACRAKDSIGRSVVIRNINAAPCTHHALEAMFTLNSPDLPLALFLCSKVLAPVSRTAPAVLIFFCSLSQLP